MWCTNRFNNQEFYILPHCIYVFCSYLKTNSDFCSIQHKLIGFISEIKSVNCAVQTVFRESSLRFVFKGLTRKRSWPNLRHYSGSIWPDWGKPHMQSELRLSRFERGTSRKEVTSVTASANLFGCCVIVRCNSNSRYSSSIRSSTAYPKFLFHYLWIRTAQS
jgi:hypothetical protein